LEWGSFTVLTAQSLGILQQVTKAVSKLLLIKKAHPYTARCGLYRDELKMLVFKGDKLNHK
jgi:hypothetical protein